MSAGFHVLAVNFRDPGHPEAGGAELHLEHILLEAVRRGHRVTWLAAGFDGGAPEGEHRGIRIVRRGNWWSFGAAVPGVLRREFSDPPPDLVIDEGALGIIGAACTIDLLLSLNQRAERQLKIKRPGRVPVRRQNRGIEKQPILRRHFSRLQRKQAR